MLLGRFLTETQGTLRIHTAQRATSSHTEEFDKLNELVAAASDRACNSTSTQKRHGMSSSVGALDWR